MCKNNIEKREKSNKNTTIGLNCSEVFTTQGEVKHIKTACKPNIYGQNGYKLVLL